MARSGVIKNFPDFKAGGRLKNPWQGQPPLDEAEMAQKFREAGE